MWPGRGHSSHHQVRPTLVLRLGRIHIDLDVAGLQGLNPEDSIDLGRTLPGLKCHQRDTFLDGLREHTTRPVPQFSNRIVPALLPASTPQVAAGTEDITFRLVNVKPADIQDCSVDR